MHSAGDMWTYIAILLADVAVVHAALNASAITQNFFGNDAPWYASRIPLFESSSNLIDSVYYYRWQTFRSHQRDLGSRGYISTEFLNDVSWQTNPWASLNDATGFHLLEGRWCRDRRFKDDYANFMLSNESNTRQYTETMADAVWQGYLVDGSTDEVVENLDRMITVFEAWSDSYDQSKGLYWVEPLRDATEYTISSIDATGGKDGFTGGDSFRPSINSYQYANAVAIAKIAELKGEMQSTAKEYQEKANAIKARVQDALWNPTFEHFVDRFYVNNSYVRYWDPIRGRELVGYVPWTHDLPDDNVTYANAWSHLLDTNKFAGPHGLRTNEPSYQYYMRQYRYEGSNPECQWNGPVWPYQTTQILKGLSNFLDHYSNGTTTGIIHTADYTRILMQYAQLHYNPERNGILDLEEDYYPDTGSPIVGLRRSPHYFHSGFVDLILTGLVGIRPRADDTIEINPLVEPSMITYFRADNILYHGHDIAVQWDSTGSKYGTKGLQLEIDGKVVASSPSLARLTAPISKIAPPKIDRPISKSIQLQANSAYPKGSVSDTSANVSDVHSAIDGRIFFYPEADAANGWSTPVGTSDEMWFQIDFGSTISATRAEIAFFTDASNFSVPQKYSIQTEQSGTWADVAGANYGQPVANGITLAEWTNVNLAKLRLVFSPVNGKRVRLVELKIF